MMDLVVDLISNLVDHRGGSNSNWGSMDNWDSMDNWGSMGNSKRSMGNSKRSSMGNGKRSSINNCRSRCIDSSNQSMSKKTMPKKAMSIKTTSNDLSISISSGGSKATDPM